MRPAEADAFLAGLADAMIREKDAIDPDPDLEPNGDEEPGLGAPEVEYQLGDYGGPPVARGHIDQRRWADGSSDEAEAVDEDGGDIDDEPQDEATQIWSLRWWNPHWVRSKALWISGRGQRTATLPAGRQSLRSAPLRTRTTRPDKLKAGRTAWKVTTTSARTSRVSGLSSTKLDGSLESRRARSSRSRKRILPKSSFVEFRPGVLHVVGGARG